MGWCDPCASDPLSAQELRKLGVFWVGDSAERSKVAPQQAQNVFVTRLHVRYDSKHFPEDLVFQATGDRQNYQGRYVIRHPWTGEATCDISNYEAELQKRQEREAQSLANLTGWDIEDIRRRIPFPDDTPPPPEGPWWKRIWG
jgi:hypothetical protein